jgi:hypothetical protein
MDIFFVTCSVTGAKHYKPKLVQIDGPHHKECWRGTTEKGKNGDLTSVLRMVGEPWLGSSAGLQIVVWEVSQDVYSHCHCLDGVQNYLCLLGKNVSTSNPKCLISCTEYSLSLYQIFFCERRTRGMVVRGWAEGDRGDGPTCRPRRMVLPAEQRNHLLWHCPCRLFRGRDN